MSFSVVIVALVPAPQQLSPRVLRSFQRQKISQAVRALLLGGDARHWCSLALFVIFLHHGSAR